MLTYTPPDSVSDGAMTNLFSILYIFDRDLFTCSCEGWGVGGMEGGEAVSFNDFKFGTLVGRFSSDGGASVAVKGLNASWQCVHLQNSRKVSIGTASSSFFNNLSVGLATVSLADRQQQIRGS